MSTDEDVPLFAGYEPPPVSDEDESLSAGQRLTKRQAADIAVGRHPLTKGRLHPLASRHRDAQSPKSDPFTCGSCWFREVIGHHSRSYPKCIFGITNETGLEGSKRVSHSSGTDVRAWWPACPDYSPSDALSRDAARHVPDHQTPATQVAGGSEEES